MNYTLGDFKKLDPKKITYIQNHLIHWYTKNHRKLPWRESSHPYAVWVSEIMLQQTRVDTVIPYFLKFMDTFKNIEALANSDEEKVLKMWEGLGYYRRAKNLHKGAKVVMEDFKGKVPDTKKEILKIPGIGPYTGGAILSIAYHQPIGAVDGNVMRVFSRIFHIPLDIGERSTQKEMQNIADAVVDLKNPSFFNQGLMELGALICTPKSPKCSICPVHNECKAFLLGIEDKLPIKERKSKKKQIVLEVGLVYKDDQILIVKRPQDGLLGDLWALPSSEKNVSQEGKSIELELLEKYNVHAKCDQLLLETEHIFTHMKWKMKVYVLTCMKDQEIDYPKIEWIFEKDLQKYPFPTAFKKIFEMK